MRYCKKMDKDLVERMNKKNLQPSNKSRTFGTKATAQVEIDTTMKADTIS